MTVQQLSNAENPILLTLSSFFGRLAIAIAGFALVVRLTEENAIWHLFVCVSAFMWVRNHLVRKVQTKIPSKFNPI